MKGELRVGIDQRCPDPPPLTALDHSQGDSIESVLYIVSFLDSSRKLILILITGMITILWSDSFKNSNPISNRKRLLRAH